MLLGNSGRVEKDDPKAALRAQTRNDKRLRPDGPHEPANNGRVLVTVNKPFEYGPAALIHQYSQDLR